MTPKQMEAVWDAHMAAEFEEKDVEAALATMTEDAYVINVPVKTGGRGRDEVRRFYRDMFIPSWPEDKRIASVHRFVGQGHVVEEVHISLTHSQPMEWFLPGVPPTHKKVEIDFVVVIEFRGDKIAAERIYWDHATVLRQVGILKG